MRKDDIIYFAGFFDGEGSICLSKRKSKYGYDLFQPQVSIQNTDKDIMEWVCKIFEFTKVQSRKRPTASGLIAYQCATSKHSKIKILLEMILPYLRVKKPQAKLLLEFIDTHPLLRGRYKSLRLNKNSDKEATIFQKLRFLNNRKPTALY